MTREHPLPLRGLTVVELGNIVAAPFASVVLADLGADVVKVERPGVGDIVRNTGESGRAIINAFNRNKRSVALDLKTEEGRKAYRDLASAADVVVENLGPGVTDRLGIGYDDLRRRNPALIYLSIKGFLAGPYGDWPGMDMVAESLSGLASMTGPPDGPPMRVGTSIADIGAALYGTIGVLVALLERDRTGEGQRVDASLFESATQWMGYWITYADMTGADHPSLGSSHPSFALYDIFETADSAEQVFVGVTSEGHWPAFCRAVDRADLLADERYDTAAKRLAHESELLEEIRKELRTWDLDALVSALVDEGVPAAPVNRPSDLLDDQHLQETGLLADVDDADGTALRTPITPIRGDRITTAQRRDPPKLGEHGREVLRELGYDETTVQEYVDLGVLGDPGA